MSFWITIVITILLMIAANALYVAAEFATVSARKSRINELAGSGDRLAKILLPIVQDKIALDNYVAACQVGITLSSLVLGAYGQSAIATALAPLLSGWGLLADLAALSVSTTLVLIVLTALQVMFGELLPKSVAIQYPERVALLTVVPLRWSLFLFRPLIWFLNGSGNLILRLLRVDYHQAEEHVHSPEEIELVVSESHEGGLLGAQERQLVRNALHLRDLMARHVMIPRIQLVAASVNQSVDTLLQLAVDEGKTRIPVYDENIDNIVGFVHLKDLFRLYLAGEQEATSAVRPVEQIPETLPILQVWDKLNRKQQYLAVVFDEYGGTVGIITFEDLVEEIFGEVQDEFDQEIPPMRSDQTGRVYLRGDLLVRDVNEYLSLRLPEDVADTLGGLILNGTGRIPAEGDEAVLGSPEVSLRAEVVEDRRIMEVSLLLPEDKIPSIEEWEAGFVFKLSLALGAMLPLLAFAAASAGDLPGLDFLIIPGLVVILLIIINGLFVMAEFAFISVRPSQMNQRAKAGSGQAKRVLSTLRSPHKQNNYVATAQLSITLASIGLGMYGEPQISHFVEPYLAWVLGFDLHDPLVTTAGYLFALGLLTYLHIVVGEMVPKSLALVSPVRAVLAVAQPMRLAGLLFAWPVHVLNSLANALLRLGRLPPADDYRRLHSAQEIEFIVSESAEEGALQQEEKDIIHKIFDFGEREVHQVMTPRNKVEAIPVDIPLPKLLALVVESNYSRLPVYKNSLDNIIGILHLRDLVRHQLKARGGFDLRLLLRRVPVVPENYSVETLFSMLKQQRTHLAIVLNEFGGTAGLVTLEDLIEEVVGEVQDEFDQERGPLLEIEPGIVEVDGKYLLDDLGDYVHLNPDTLPEVETVGGLIMTKLGRLPRVGDRVIHQGDIHFTVIEVDKRAVTWARVEFPVGD